jgi:cell division protein FtsQ
MKKFKKILFIFIGTALFFGLVVSMAFVSKESNSLLCKNLDIKINNDDELFFLDKNDIIQFIRNRGDSIKGQPKSTINISKIEHALNSHEDIAKAVVYMTIENEMKVQVQQRKPILRIINNKDESYYLDDEGRMMPLSEKYTSNVLVANGNISESYGRNYLRSVADIAKDSTLKYNSKLDELYAIATYINSNTFLKAQIQQIYVNDDKEMELIPLVGNHKIIFGDTSYMEEKFKKLFVFYTQGINYTGDWNKYSTINLKFKNQIVCNKK